MVDRIYVMQCTNERSRAHTWHNIHIYVSYLALSLTAVLLCLCIWRSPSECRVRLADCCYLRASVTFVVVIVVVSDGVGPGGV